MKKARSGGQIEEESEAQMAVRELPARELPGVSRVQGTDSHTSGVGERDVSLEQEVGGLEAARAFAEETGIDISESRPCVATLFLEGVVSGTVGRKPSAFILALELAVCGVSPSDIERHVETFASRCAPPVPKNQQAAVIRAIQKDNNRYRYGCSKLQAWCIGPSVCPWKKKTASSLSVCRRSSPTAFVALGWLAYLKGSTTSVFLALVGMRMQRGLAPGAAFTFYFAQLETRSAVSRSELRRHLETLRDVGLLTELAIGPPWNSRERKRTKVRLTAPIPDPKLLGLTPLKEAAAWSSEYMD